MHPLPHNGFTVSLRHKFSVQRYVWYVSLNSMSKNSICSFECVSEQHLGVYRLYQTELRVHLKCLGVVLLLVTVLSYFCIMILQTINHSVGGEMLRASPDNRLLSEYRFSLNLLVDLGLCQTMTFAWGGYLSLVLTLFSFSPLIPPSISLSPISFFV